MAFTEPLEGWVPTMYLDSRGLVTVGIGNLIDPLPFALPLPFRNRVTKAPAGLPDIISEWQVIKASKTSKTGWKAAQRLCRLELSIEAVEDLVENKLDQNDRHLTMRFPEFQSWPADAQLATHSMAWACGPSFRYPLMMAFLRAQRFADAAGECTINPQVGTIVWRNQANRVMYRNAGCVVKDFTRNPDVLYWPNDLSQEPEYP